jgi:hypothetical protein
MPVNIDEDSQLPTYDNIKFLGANKIPFILLLIVIIVIYIFLFTFLNNMSLNNESNKWWILILEIILVIVLIVVVALNIKEFNIKEFNFSTEIKNLFNNKRTEININADKKEKEIPTCKPSTDASDGEVFHIFNNKYSYKEAKNVCSSLNARLATYDEVENAYNKGGGWCSYGWSDDQLALFPTQKDTYNKLKKIVGHENDCGRQGVNGGYIENTKAKFGANCFGIKPKMTERDKKYMDHYSFSPYYTDASYADFSGCAVDTESDSIDLLIAPFNKSKWTFQ